MTCSFPHVSIKVNWYQSAMEDVNPWHGLHLVLCIYPNTAKWRQMNSDRGTITIAVPNGHIKMITTYNWDIRKTMHDIPTLIILHISALIRSKILTLRSGSAQILATHNLQTTAAIRLWISGGGIRKKSRVAGMAEAQRWCVPCPWRCGRLSGCVGAHKFKCREVAQNGNAA